MYTGDQDSVGGREFTGLDEEGNPIYGKAPKPEAGKSFNDAIKDLFWDVLGREPRPEELSAYKRDFGAKIDPSEEKIFFERSQQEIQNRNDPILNLYKETTGRDPTFDEYRATRKELGGDVSAEEKTGFMDQIFQKETLPGLRQRQDPLFQLYRNELGRDPDAAGYRYYQEQFGQPAYITDQMRKEFLGAGGQEVTSRIPDAFRTLMGRDPTQQEIQELSRNVGTLNPDQMGEYLATKNRAFTNRYTKSPNAGYIAQNLPSNLTPFTRTQGYVPLSRPNVSASMNVAGQQYYQTPTSLGANYIGAPTNIAPITQGFQPVGQPSVPSYYPQSFQPMGGNGGFQFQPQFRSQELPSQQAPTQQFQPMGGKGVPRAITGKGG
jgi:hypothetical protein